jgi:hypothetical protein
MVGVLGRRCPSLDRKDIAKMRPSGQRTALSRIQQQQPGEGSHRMPTSEHDLFEVLRRAANNYERGAKFEKLDLAMLGAARGFDAGADLDDDRLLARAPRARRSTWGKRAVLVPLHRDEQAGPQHDQRDEGE